MNVALLKAGIDTGSGGTPGPLFEDGTYELIPNLMLSASMNGLAPTPLADTG